MGGTHTNSVEPLFEPLTRREREVLALLAGGLTAPEIAEKLTIAVSSVKYHIQHVYGKLGVHGRRQAVARARDLSLLQPASLVMQSATPSTVSPGFGHNLPQQLTRLIGRDAELTALKHLVVDGRPSPARLVSLVGPGGVGKSRLSLALAQDALTSYDDGVWLIELAPLSEAELIVTTLSATLGLRDEIAGANAKREAVHPLLDTVTGFLQAKHCLLVIDNREHLVTACAQLAVTLLQRCPRLHILATSREPLGAAGEVVWPLAGLEMPPAATPAGLELQQATNYASIELFAERAHAARPDFSVTLQNAASVTQICRLLDGLPLAIELAAARVALLPVEQIAALLAAQDGFRLLTGGRRTALPRHQTLMATIEWSYQLLVETERKLLRRLAVFSGGWSLEAAESVCADVPLDAAPSASALPASEVLQTLGQLAAKSLVISEPMASGAARFHLLETIREFALVKLETSEEAAAVRQRQCDFFLALAEQAEPETRGHAQLTWFDRLTVEHDNLRRALEWSVLQREVTTGLRLASALHYYWDIHCNIVEAHAWYTRLLVGKPAPQRSVAWALALARAASFASSCADWKSAAALAESSLALSRELGPAGQASAAYALIELGRVRHWQNSFELDAPGPERPATLEAMMQESLTLFELSGDNWGRARALQVIGFATKLAGDYQQASRAYEQSRALFEQLGDLFGMVQVIVHLGELAAWHGRYDRARDLYEGALNHFRRLRAWTSAANALWSLALALNDLGQYESAMAGLSEAVTLGRARGDLKLLEWFLADQASMAYEHGHYETAAALLEESRKLAAELGDTDWLAMLQFAQARLVRAHGDPARAVRMTENVLPVLQSGGHVWWTAFAREVLAEGLRDQGEYARATAHLEASLAFFRERRKWREVATLLLRLGDVARRRGEYPHAGSLLSESLRRCQLIGPRPIMAACLAQLAYLWTAIAQAAGTVTEAEHAARLLGAYEAMCKAMGSNFPPADVAERTEYENSTLTLNKYFGEDRFEALRAAGGAMGTEAAVTEALAALEARQQ